MPSEQDYDLSAFAMDARPPPDFLESVNERLLSRQQPKSQLKPLFEAHMMFQRPYQTPSPSPSPNASRSPSLSPMPPPIGSSNIESVLSSTLNTSKAGSHAKSNRTSRSRLTVHRAHSQQIIKGSQSSFMTTASRRSHSAKASPKPFAMQRHSSPRASPHQPHHLVVHQWNHRAWASPRVIPSHKPKKIRIGARARSSHNAGPSLRRKVQFNRS